jgi:hypothetical protein
MRAKPYAERAYRSGAQGVGSLSATRLKTRSNYVYPTTCRYHLPHVEAYVVPYVRVGYARMTPIPDALLQRSKPRLGPTHKSGPSRVWAR